MIAKAVFKPAERSVAAKVAKCRLTDPYDFKQIMDFNSNFNLKTRRNILLRPFNVTAYSCFRTASHAVLPFLQPYCQRRKEVRQATTLV